MADAKHTPGPWRVCGGATPAYMAIHSVNGYVVFSLADPAAHSEWMPARAISAPSYREQRANARLIATAPDMLLALEECEAVLSALSQVLKPLSNEPALVNARAALAKAKGVA